MATKYSDYNYQQDIENVLNAKIGWNNATTDEERKKQSDLATAARDRLKAYGYEDIANQISASGADATTTRKIFEQYSQPKTTTYPIETNNLKSNEVNRENAGSFEKHNEVYDYIMKTDPFETSEGKAIMGKYDLAGLKGRDNAVASGGASNGGNIDSYAAANAMRQQAALVNQGQTAVLNAHQQKIDNARGILSDIGVNIDRVFNQDETAKNNNVARLSEQANVTGYTPSEWVIANDDVYNTYLNADGTFKKELENVDIQALINSAKASGDTETAKKLAVVRARKMLGNYGEFGKYANEGDISYMSPQITEARRESEQNDATVRETLKSESADTRYGIDAEKEIAANANQNAIDQIKAQTLGEKEILELTQELANGTSVYELTDKDKDTAKLVFDKINNQLSADSNYTDIYPVDGLLKIEGNGMTLNGDASTWWVQVLRPLLSEPSLSSKAKLAIASNLGFSDEQVDDVLLALENESKNK